MIRSLSTLAVAALLVLTGCATATAPADAPSGALPAAEGTTQYPLTLTTWAGETVLERRPERVAVIGFSPNVDALEVLGVVPVYSQAEETAWPWRDPGWFAQIEFRDTATRRDPINFEAIASTNPDLIVATNYVQEQAEFERLSAIAPVLENPERVAGDRIQWQETQRMLGRALDLPAAADRAVAEAEAGIDATARENPRFAGRTITVASDYAASGIDYYTVTGGTAEQIVGRMGFAPNPLAQNFAGAARVSDEQIDLLDADVLLMFYRDAETRDARLAQPLFQRLPPVVEGRYVGITAEEPEAELTWVLRRGASALSVPWAVDVIAQRVNSVELP